jgi:hypothetical protein
MIKSGVKSYRVIKSSMLFTAALLAGAITAPQARSEEIAGTWSGGGTVTYASGQQERARCTAHYSGFGSVVSLSANCATSSGSISQPATLRRTGPKTYSGEFFNQQYNVSGTIQVVVHGNTQTVSLKGGSMSGSLTLEYRSQEPGTAPRSMTLFKNWE